MLSYRIPKDFTPVVVPHGNSKTHQPSFPTLLSTKVLIATQRKPWVQLVRKWEVLWTLVVHLSFLATSVMFHTMWMHQVKRGYYTRFWDLRNITLKLSSLQMHYITSSNTHKSLVNTAIIISGHNTHSTNTTHNNDVIVTAIVCALIGMIVRQKPRELLSYVTSKLWQVSVLLSGRWCPRIGWREDQHRGRTTCKAKPGARIPTLHTWTGRWLRPVAVAGQRLGCVPVALP